jgi:hypothetical protein
MLPPVPLDTNPDSLDVTPGALETISIATARGAHVAVLVQFPNGATTQSSALAGSDGSATVRIRIPVTAYSPNGLPATVSVSATLGDRTRYEDVVFFVTLPRLAILFAHNPAAMGASQTVTVLSAPHTPVQLRVRLPSGAASSHTGQTGSNGALIYTFAVPRRHVHPGDQIVVSARTLSGRRLTVTRGFSVTQG